MSSIVIDTHILIWDQLDPKIVSAKARKVIDLAEKNHKIILCEISLWEISILMKKRRLVIDMAYLDFIDDVVDELGSRNAINYIRTILEQGTGADRQLAVYRETGSLERVVDYITEETLRGI